jgi:hypothetical protein
MNWVFNPCSLVFEKRLYKLPPFVTVDGSNVSCMEWCIITLSSLHSSLHPGPKLVSKLAVLCSTADGERLVMKGAKLTGQEMLQAFQSRCLAKDTQAKAKK